MGEELIDITDEKGNALGASRTRGEIHAKGLWHREVHIWIYDSRGDVLLQKRSMQKDTWPGKWDVATAGHVSAGETPEQAALKEMREEIGIGARFGDIRQVMVCKASTSPKPDYYNNKFEYVYLFKLNKLPKNLQKEEVDSVKFVPLPKFEEELNNHRTMKNFVPHGYLPDLLKVLRKEIAREEKANLKVRGR